MLDASYKRNQFLVNFGCLFLKIVNEISKQLQCKYSIELKSFHIYAMYIRGIPILKLRVGRVRGENNLVAYPLRL